MVDISLGTANIGGLRRRIECDEAFQIFDRAWELGIRHFDTACLYGAGRAESLLGAWITDRGIERSEIFVTTKIARHLVTPCDQHPYSAKNFPGGDEMSEILDYSYEGALRQAEAGLERLQLEYVDALLLHDVDLKNLGAYYCDLLPTAMRCAYQALQELKDRGYARSVGLGVNNYETYQDFYDADLKIDCGVLAGRYTLAEQHALPLLERAKENGTQIFLAGNLNSGLFAGRPLYDYQAAADDKVLYARRVDEICRNHGVYMGAAALQFSAAAPAAAQIVIGPDSMRELEENIQWMGVPIPAGLWVDLKKADVIRGDAPVPQGPGSLLVGRLALEVKKIA